MATKWLLSSAILTFIFIISIGTMELFGIISFSSSMKLIDVNYNLGQEINNKQINNNSDLSLSSELDNNDNDSLYNCDYLIYQCAIGNDWEIRDMFKWSHPWIITVRDYAKMHNYCYKFDIFTKEEVLSFLNENNYHWSQARFVLVKTFGIYCIEYSILKYSPKWLLYLDIDVSIPPKTFYHRTLKQILNEIQTLYQINNDRFLNEITFIAQDLKYTLNSGVIFINNNHHNWHKNRFDTINIKKNKNYDIIDHWNDTKYSHYSQLLMSPKLLQFFDRIKSSLHHREYSLFFGYDQVVLQDVILFYANLAFLKNNHTINAIVDQYLLNKTKGDDEYLFYNKNCMEHKIVREHNNCYWGSLNKWGFPFGQRQFGPILLVSQHKYRMNMHQHYEDGDIFLHARNFLARNQTIQWIKQYNMSVGLIWEKLPR